MKTSTSATARVALFSLLAAAAFQANAQDARLNSQRGGYIGASIGQLNYEEDLGAFIPGYQFDESASSVSLYGGYRFGGWGIEGGYRDVDTLEDSATQFVPGFGTASATIGTDVESLEFRFIGYAPVGKGSFVFGAGYAEWDYTSFISVQLAGFPSERFEDSDSDGGATGLLAYQLELRQVDLRFAYELWDVEDGDADQLSVGVAFRF